MKREMRKGRIVWLFQEVQFVAVVSERKSARAAHKQVPVTCRYFFMCRHVKMLGFNTMCSVN
jgi:hypothetical protein